MKRKIYQLVKKYGVIVDHYNSYRSDMGCQVFEINFKINNRRNLYFNDAYWIGDSNKGHKYLLDKLEVDLFIQITEDYSLNN